MSYIVTDIETVADPSVWDAPEEIPKISEDKKPTSADLAHLDAVQKRRGDGLRIHPADLEKAADIARRAGQEALAALLGKDLPPKDPMPPVYACRPIVIGCARLDEDLVCTRIGAIGEEGEPAEIAEPRMIRAWSDYMANGKKIVSWFGRGFDLPVLVSRALYRGVPLAWYFDENYRYRYSEDKHIDLCDVLSNYGAVRSGIKLDGYTRCLGLPGKPGVDGSMVGKMYADGRYDEIVAYCLTDVIGTVFAFLRWRLIKGTDVEKFRAAVDSVFACLDGTTLHPLVASWIERIDRKKVALR